MDLHYSRVSYIKVIRNAKAMRKAPTTVTTTTTTTMTTTTKEIKAPVIKGQGFVKLGEVIQLACLVNDDDAIDVGDIAWFHNGKQLSTTSQVYDKVATYDDIGNYTCSSSKLTAASFALAVGNGPIVFFDVQSEIVRLYPDSKPFNLTCVTKLPHQDVEYNSAAVDIIQWMIITDDKTRKQKTINGSSVILRPPLPSNFTYTVTCHAETQFGASSQQIRYKQQPYYISHIAITNGGDSAPPKLILGDNRLLTCTASGHPLPLIEWRREAAGSALPLEKDRTMAWSNGTLSIYEIQPLDSGVYICTASNVAGQLTKRVTVNIVEAPSLSLPPRPSPFSRDQNVRVNCAPSTGTPPFTFKWDIKPHEAKVNYTVDMFDANSVLDIKKLSDDLNVTCLAMNDAGKTASTVQLVIGAEIEIESVRGPTVTEGERLELNCHSFLPVQWIINGRLLSIDERVRVIDNRLIIDDMQRFDAGAYECTDGNVYTRVEVNVVKTPVVTIKYPGKLVKPGMSITMSCHADGHPMPEVRFYKSDQLMTTSPLSNTIAIEQMEKDNEGSYTCQALNAIGSVSETIELAIKSPWVNPSYQEVFSGDQTKMSCFSTSKNIVWRGPITDGTVNGQAPIIEANERFNITNEVLTVKKTFISDSGRYSCTNIANGESHEAMVHVKTLPAQFLHTPLSMAKVAIPSSWYNAMEIQFKFRTADASNGTLFYIGGSNNVDFFKIQLNNGKLTVEWNLGSGTGRIYGVPSIVINKWYYVMIERDEKQCTMAINGQKSRGQSPGAFTGFDYTPFGLIGGGQQNQPAFIGCLLDMYLNGNMVDFGMLESIGLTTCKAG